MEYIGNKWGNKKNRLTLTGSTGGGKAIQRQRNGERNSVQRQVAPRESLNLAILTNVLDCSHNLQYFNNPHIVFLCYQQDLFK